MTKTTCIGLLMVAWLLAACAGVPDKGGEDQGKAADDAAAMGIRVEGIRLAAAGYMLDFRYRVLDPETAARAIDRRVKPYLLVEESGAALAVPNPPKVGPLRQTRSRPIAGRTYFVFFANPGRQVQPGSRVTVVMGDAKLGPLTVQ